MDNTLLPCPFCGRKAAERDIKVPGGNGWVGCQRCRCFMDFVKNGKLRAIAAWNSRAEPELTRCEKCDYWDKSASFMSAHACAFWSSGKKTRYTENYEFCSFAERKEE